MNRFQTQRAFLNSYNVIIRGYDALLIITQGGGYFAHNPGEGLDKEDLLGMLDYFEEQEDYVKCEEINNFINKRWNLETTKKK